MHKPLIYGEMAYSSFYNLDFLQMTICYQCYSLLGFALLNLLNDLPTYVPGPM